MFPHKQGRAFVQSAQVSALALCSPLYPSGIWSILNMVLSLGSVRWGTFQRVFSG